MQQTLKAIKEHFDHHSFKYSLDEDDSCVRSEFTGKNCYMKLEVRGDESRLHVSVYPMIIAPRKVRRQIAELVLRRNWTLPFGRFDYQIKTGKVIFEYATMLAGPVKDQLIQDMIGFSLTASDEFVPAHSLVAFAEASPSDALKSELDIDDESFADDDEESDDDDGTDDSESIISDQDFRTLLLDLGYDRAGDIGTAFENVNDMPEPPQDIDPDQLGFDF